MSLSLTARQCKTGSVGVLLMAVDPSTGDSLLHSAAAGANVAGVRGIQDAFRTSRLARSFHMLVAHRNASGDTALHVAVRGGHQDVVTAVYRLFCDDWLPGRRALKEARRLPRRGEFVEDEEEDYVPPLVSLVDVKRAGHDAAAEARAAGHEDLARWLEAVVARRQGISPKGADGEVRRLAV